MAVDQNWNNFQCFYYCHSRHLVIATCLFEMIIPSALVLLLLQIEPSEEAEILSMLYNEALKYSTLLSLMSITIGVLTIYGIQKEKPALLVPIITMKAMIIVALSIITCIQAHSMHEDRLGTIVILIILLILTVILLPRVKGKPASFANEAAFLVWTLLPIFLLTVAASYIPDDAELVDLLTTGALIGLFYAALAGLCWGLLLELWSLSTILKCYQYLKAKNNHPTGIESRPLMDLMRKHEE